MKPLPVLLTPLLLAGCTQLQHQEDQLASLSAQVETLNATLERTEARLLAMQLSMATELESNRVGVDQLGTAITVLPDTLKSMCPPPSETDSPRCDENPEIERVMISGDKMVLGELESVWIDPPGMNLIAQIDTGASANSLNAEGMVLFERDGDDWVRFHVRDSTSDELIELEREVVRFVRVYQQADPEGTRRPVVNMRLRLGDVRDTFEFTLADRSHLNHQILLGRSFITDIALVDVGRQFVQPRFRPKRPE